MRGLQKQNTVGQQGSRMFLNKGRGCITKSYKPIATLVLVEIQARGRNTLHCSSFQANTLYHGTL